MREQDEGADTQRLVGHVYNYVSIFGAETELNLIIGLSSVPLRSLDVSRVHTSLCASYCHENTSGNRPSDSSWYLRSRARSDEAF